MAAPVVHWEINTKDPNRLFQFYSDVFGWKVNSSNPLNYGVVDTGVKMGINGGIGGTKEGTPQFVTFYIQVEDVQAHLDKAVASGARVVVPLTDIPNMITYALFEDPDGNKVGLVKGPQTPPKSPAAKKRAPKKKTPRAKRGKAKKRGRR